MTTCCEPDNLDLARGVWLSRHAYRSRMQKEPLQIVAAKFETSDGKTLAEYRAEQIAEAAR